jgi:hypothetical protein
MSNAIRKEIQTQPHGQERSSTLHEEQSHTICIVQYVLLAYRTLTFDRLFKKKIDISLSIPYQFGIYLQNCIFFLHKIFITLNSSYRYAIV